MNEIHLPSREICDRARASKDARFDGLFFIAVRSTKIYCRPVCPAPTAKGENVTYYPTAADAIAAGYRACLRCRPDLPMDIRIHGNEEAMHRALELIAKGALEENSIDALASQVGLSARQLRRLFLANTGATPVAVHATRRLLQAKHLLTQTKMSITQIALEAGFKSLRRFNSAFREVWGMTPTAMRRAGAAYDDMHSSNTLAHMMTLRLAYRPPLAFADTLKFLAERALPSIERITENSYERVIGLSEDAAWIRVTQADDRPELRLEISGTNPQTIPDIVRRIRRMFDLDADLRSAHAALAEDSLLADSIRKNPGLHVPGAWDGFEVMVRAVLGEKFNPKAVTALVEQLIDRFGERHKNIPPELNRIFPTPLRLLNAPLEEIGISKSQTSTLRSLASSILDARLDFRPGQFIDAFVSRATAIPGIDSWMAHYVAMRALNQPDAFPSDDPIIHRTLGKGRNLSTKEIDARSQAWRPWRAYAAIHLWSHE